MPTKTDLDRIRDALLLAGEILRRHAESVGPIGEKAGGDPVTQADLETDAALRETLPVGGEGWLSEETGDDLARLACARVWIVDPLDGTKEFVAGIPEWCVSIGLVENGVAIAGGVLNPVRDQMIVGALGEGVTLNGDPVAVGTLSTLSRSTVLASRSEVTRGEWKSFEGDVHRIEPTGSVAYKLGLVAAGLADASWTLVPKNEWDVAAGSALVNAAGGVVRLPDWSEPVFNRRDTVLPGLVASSSALFDDVRRRLSIA